MRNKKRKKEVYNTVEEAVAAIFAKQNDRKRMFSTLFWLAVVGAIIIATGTHFLIKQQAVIEQASDVDWRNYYTNKGDLSYVQEDTVKTDEKLEMFFVGDLMLDRYNRTLAYKHGVEWLTTEVNHFFLQNDFNVANLEGPVTSHSSVSIDSEEGAANNYIFTFDPDQTRRFLDYNKINLLNLGNNHILNFGQEGLTSTENFLTSNGIEFFGDIRKGEGGYLEKLRTGRKLAFVSYNQFGGNSFEEVLENVRNLEDSADVTIVYAHWGQEYELIENDSQRNKARAFVDAGADLIIGSHPHVVQSVEEYKGVKIFYSLGNFVFDQYFSEETRIGLGVKVIVSQENELSFELITFEISKVGDVKIADRQTKEKLLQRIGF